MICGVLKCAIANDIDRPSRSFQLFLCENKWSLFIPALIESPGDLTMDDMADDQVHCVYKTRQLWQAVVSRSTDKYCCHVAYKPLPVTHARDYATVEFCVRQMICSLLLLEII